MTGANNQVGRQGMHACMHACVRAGRQAERGRPAREGGGQGSTEEAKEGTIRRGGKREAGERDDTGAGTIKRSFDKVFFLK